MLNSKYSNVLTMLLVVFIVAILGIIGYFTYDLINSKSVNANAQATMDEFEKKTISKASTDDEDQNVVNSTNDPLAELSALTANTTSTTETTTEEVEKVYMEGYEVKGTIKIPKTGIEYPVLKNVTKRSLEIAVAIAYGSGINEVGNTVIFGHNYRNGLFFSDNKKLSNGDKIYLTDQTGQTITYSIYNIYETTPNDATYFTRETNGKREISLQTCTDDSSGRLIIWAIEDEENS